MVVKIVQKNAVFIFSFGGPRRIFGFGRIYGRNFRPKPLSFGHYTIYRYSSSGDSWILLNKRMKEMKRKEKNDLIYGGLHHAQMSATPMCLEASGKSSNI
jgi:hypothetical protein